MRKLSIKEWAEEDRPREKLLLRGAGALSNSELIAILIRSGNDKESAVELSRRMLSDADNNLNRLARMGAAELMQRYRGIGEAKAVAVIAALELGSRRKAEAEVEREQICSSADAYNYFYPLLCDLNHEELWVLLTDRSNRVLRTLQVSRGGIGGTVIDTRLILREALLHYASGIFLGHNHPSGNCKASAQDIKVTRNIKTAAACMDIMLLDHIIVCGNNYCSFADMGII